MICNINLSNNNKQFSAFLNGVNGNRVKDLLPKHAAHYITKVINQDNVKSQFNPMIANVGLDNRELVGKIGIGLGGKVLDNKMSMAYTRLIPGEGDRAINLKTSFSNTIIFGKVEYIINLSQAPGTFYDTFHTTYIGSNHLRIPWMKIYIDGLDRFENYIYIDGADPRFNRKSSRTSIGHMIKLEGGSYEFDGVGRNLTFGVLLDALKKEFNSSRAKASLVVAIKSAMGW